MNANQNFLEFVLEQTNQTETNKDKELNSFLSKVPSIHHSLVKWIIKNRYYGNLQSYKNSIPLFFELFTINDVRICDGIINTNKSKQRKQIKARKQTILWSAQLLKLVGKNGTDILPLSISNEWLEDQRKQKEFAENSKLINAFGKFSRLKTPEKRREIRSAQNYGYALLLDQLAIDRGYTFAFITLTLTPHMHCNPTKGRNSYKGCKPQEAENKLQGYWELIRANLAKIGIVANKDFFGIQVKEGHKDSTLHCHILVYIHPDNLDLLKDVVFELQDREKIKISNELNMNLKEVKFQWDFKKDNGKARASSYIFKYISPDMSKKANVSNEALRSYYCVRSFAFFGCNSKIGIFNHICNNYKSYKDVIENKDVLEMLETKDLYKFYTKYMNDFENVSVKSFGKKIFIGVSYVPDRNKKNCKNKEILIQKKQFAIIENFNFNQVILTFPNAQKKQMNFNELLVNYFEKQNTLGFDNYSLSAMAFFSETSSKIILEYMNEELELSKKVFDNNVEDYFKKDFYKDKEEIGVILNHYSSRKSTSLIFEVAKVPAMQSKDEEKHFISA